MASLDRLVKALDSLRASDATPAAASTAAAVSGSSSGDLGSSLRSSLPDLRPSALLFRQRDTAAVTLSSADKKLCCRHLADGLVRAPVRGNAELLQSHLPAVVETMMQLVDDTDADVRTAADENLNRIIRGMSESNIGRLLVELFRVIKLNGAARSICSALSKFSQLAHKIRPQKRRAYVVNLFPCLLRLSQRSEVAVQECLSSAVVRLAPVLGVFFTDPEVKMLLRAFLPNLAHSTATLRRSANQAIIAIVGSCRKHDLFVPWLLATLVECVSPTDAEPPVGCVLGALLCLRDLVPMLEEHGDGLELDRMLQLLELLLHFALHVNHNVVTAALDALCQLIRSPSAELLAALVSPGVISRSYLLPVDSLQHHRPLSKTPSVLSVVAPSIGDDTPHQQLIEPDLWPTAPSVASLQSQTTCREDGQLQDGDATDEANQIVPSSDETVFKNLHSSASEDVDSSVSHPSEDAVLLVGTPPKDDVIDPLRYCLGSIGEDSVSSSVLENQPQMEEPVADCTLRSGDIGSLTDGGVALVHCCRFLASHFLLTGVPGTLRSDRDVRVSVKVLGLNCIAAAIALAPDTLALPLHIDLDSSDVECQYLYDVFRFSTDPDPQLRGSVAFLCGTYLRSWTLQRNVEPPSEQLAPTVLVDMLKQLLSDSSHVTARQALEAVGACVPPLLSSWYAHLLPGLLLPLFSLADNSYWLVKIGLCTLVGSLPLTELEVVWAAATGYSDSCLHQLLLGLLLQLLEDADQRVQLAAAQAVVQYTARLPKSAALHGGASSAVDVTALCVDACAHARLDLLTSSASVWSSGLPGASGASCRPATSLEDPTWDSCISCSLSVVVDRLVNALLVSLDSRQAVVGYLSAMRVLMERYPATVYPEAWQLCHTKQRRTLYHLCVSMLTFTNHLHDLISHRNLIYLSAHLAAGLCAHQRRQSSASPVQPAGSAAGPAATSCSDDSTTDAAAGEDELLASWDLVEPLFIHLLRVACVYTHLVEETVPTPLAPPKPSLPNFPSPSALSPIRRRTVAEPPAAASPVAVAQPVDRPATPDRPEKDAEKKTKPSVGFFLSSPEYVKFYHTMKTIYGTYEITLNAQSTHKLLDLLNDCLTGLAVVLELVGTATVAPLADELLDYLNSLIAIAPATSLHCTLQLLRAMFGRSMAVGGRDGVSDLSNSPTAPAPPRDTGDHHTSCSLYEVCINEPYVQFVAAIGLQRRLTSSSSESTVVPRPECDVGRPASSTNRNADKQSLTSYIRLFESAVIKALKLYTVTSEAPVQRQVLWLLVQLVQLRVNYCLLDADQIFIGYVIKQLEYVEEGQMKEGSEIVAAVFSFLMLLSYERYHSKTVVSVPKILQLCEGLIASGLSPDLYALPALRPIMEDLYMTPRPSVQDSEELNTQREVLFSMLLRLIHYSTTLDLCVAVLCECRRGQGGGDDRWRLASRQLLDSLLPALERLAVQLDSAADLTSLHRLLAAVCPRALRPAEDVLGPMLQPPPDAASVSELQRWGGRLCALLRLLVTQVREDVLLSRLEDLGVAGGAVTAAASKDGRQDSESRTVTPPEILVRFLLSSVELLATQLSSVSASPLMVNTPTYLPAILAQILQTFTYIIQSGSFVECARCAVWLLRGPSPLYDVRLTCDAFVSLRHCHPLLVLGWCNLLTLLGYSRLDFWRHLLQLPSVSPSDGSVTGAISLPMAVVSRGALILLCDYLCEDSSDGELLAWLLTNNISELLQLAGEPPVSDLLASLHRNPSASGLLIQSVATRCLCMQQPLIAHRALRCLEGTPVSQYGPLFLLLSQRLMSSCHLVVADEAVQLACRKMEIVIAAEDRLISEEHFSELVDNVSKLNNLYRQKRLVELVTQIGDKLFGVSVQLLPAPPAWSLGEAEADIPDYRWFCQLVSRCCAWLPAPAAECAQLLAKLERPDMESLLNSASTDSAVLTQCFTVADAITRTQQFESPLYGVAESVFQKQLTELCQLFPSPDNAFAADRYRKYNRLLESTLADSTLWERLITCCQTATAYLGTRHVPRANRHLQPPAGLATPMARLTLLALEAAWFSVTPRRCACPRVLRALLSAAGAGLRFGAVSACLARHDYQWTALTVNAIYKLVQTLVGALPDPAVTMVARVPDIRMYQRIASLIIWAENEHVPQGTAATLKSIVVSVGRLPLLSSFLRVPPDVYQQHGHQLAAAGSVWSQEAASTSRPSVEYSRDARFSPVPVQSLQEADVLRQYISRVNLLGWCDRREFEETWMTYLSVLNASAEDSTAVSEEQAVLMQTDCLAVRGMTSLLLQTMTSMVPGHPGVGATLHHPRDLKPIFVPGSVISHFDQFLMELQTAVESCSLLSPSVALGSVELSVRQLNVDRRQDSWLFGHGQVSLRYLRMVISGREGVHSSRDQVLEAAGLDINSCVVFLLQLYEQWLGPGMSLALPLLTETVRSAVLLSDLMTERGQYEWLLARCSALYQLHPVDDEIMLPYLVLGLCKSAAVLDACDGAVLETVRRAVEHGLRCTLPPVRISTLHGCLYLLQLGPGQLSSSVLPCLTEFLQHNFSVISTLPGHNDDYDLAVWAVALYVIQHYDDGLAGQSAFSPQLLQHAYSLAAATRSPVLHEALMKGIEQLVVCGTVSGAAGPMRLALEQVRLQEGTGVRLLWAVSLLFACLFAAPVHQQLDAESHVQVLETYSTLVNKLKTVPGYMADILCSSMTAGVLRLCPPAEMMNKVIAEFISPNQLHPRAMASAIFKVFEWCVVENQRPLLQDWVLFSVPNFTSYPVLPRATWQLTCFLLSASCSCWLRAAFPLLLRCSYDFESLFSTVHLSELFVIAARDFYQQISESQREQFIAAVQQPASSGDPMYQRLLKSLTDGSSGIASLGDTSG